VRFAAGDWVRSPGELHVLDVSREIDGRLGGYLNDLRVEAEYLELVGPPSA